MATIDYWAEAPMSRGQISLFAPTLDAMIGSDDPVRLFDEVLAGLDWSAWEGEYHGRVGQPPIHPRHVAAGLLYGLCRGIRSSRKLEEACCYRLDFIWLLEGRQIDHTTFAKFRTRFTAPLKDLFGQIGRIAMTLGLIRLGEVAFDGTRVKANNSRYATRTAKLPRNSRKQLDKSCFVYDAQQDLYYCPQGHAMPFEKTKPEARGGTRVTLRVYRCGSCEGCPLAAACVSPENHRGRTITRDDCEEARERAAARMARASARELYKQRPRIAETTFGVMKLAMGIRQFLLRGLEKVQTEWRWAATAFNLGKLVREIGRMRAEFTALASTTEG